MLVVVQRPFASFEGCVCNIICTSSVSRSRFNPDDATVIRIEGLGCFCAGRHSESRNLRLQMEFPAFLSVLPDKSGMGEAAVDEKQSPAR